MIIFCCLLSLHIPLFVKIAINAPNSFPPPRPPGRPVECLQQLPKVFLVTSPAKTLAPPIIVIWKFHFFPNPTWCSPPSLCVTDCRQLLLQLSLNCRSSHTSLHFSISFYVILCVFQQFHMNVRILELSLNCRDSRTFLQLRCVGGSLNIGRENSFLSKFINIIRLLAA